MPVNTEQKRKSAATVANPWNGPTVIPTGGFDQADRQHIAWSYSGILAASTAPGQPVMVRMQGVPTMPGYRDRPGKWNIDLGKLWRKRRRVMIPT